MENTHDYLFKIILIGDSGVGKTSLMRRYTDNVYTSDGASTIGVDFKIKTIVVDGKRVKLQIWDTAGQERFKAIVAHYYRGANGIMLVFDMLNRETFEHLSDWMAELDKREIPKQTQIKILGNKVDCKEKVQVTRADVLKFLEQHSIPAANFYEVSAQESLNVEESFLTLTRNLINIFGSASAKMRSKVAFKSRDSKQSNRCC
ncbi:Ras-related protein Rab-1A [Pancytospora philotis]|nr:Ras-related protein Rab-1A [Pancytospora philotis]